MKNQQTQTFKKYSMNLSRSIKNSSLLTILALLTTIAGMAQDKTVASAPPAEAGYNLLATLLVIMIMVLAFVIWGMGQVLTALGRQLLDKKKQPSKIIAGSLLIGFIMLSQLSFAQGAPVAAVKTAPDYGGLSESAFWFFVTVLVTEVTIIFFLGFSIRRMYTELLPEKMMAPGQPSKLLGWWNGLDKKIFTKAVPVEKEADVLLDHDYDGIRELDNALPPWWKYGFYVTIAVGIIYLFNFHVMGLGKNPTQEYQAEVKQALIDKERYEATNKDKVDENNVPMADPMGIREGQQLFEANCAACHLKDGGGSVGPNLTDNYWLHKGSLNDIYRTIKYGYPDKGMQSWSSQFSPKQMSHLTSFIKSLQGTKPANAKEQQGEFWVEAPVKDSASAKTDSAAVIK
jgi:cytochrome c oxidase cbb3-type subunit III